MAAIGSGDPPPRPPPSKRQDTWGSMAGYINIYTGVGRWVKNAAKICGGLLPIVTAASTPEARARSLSKLVDTAPLAFQRHPRHAQKLGTTSETPSHPLLANLNPDSMVPYPDVFFSARRRKILSPILLSRSLPSIPRRAMIHKSA